MTIKPYLISALFVFTIVFGLFEPTFAANVTEKAYRFTWIPTEQLTILQTFLEEAKFQGWNVTVKESLKEIGVPYEKSKNETFEEILVNKLRSCIKYDEGCRTKIVNNNRRTFFDPSEIQDNFEGALILPTKSSEFSIAVEAGANYREETIGNRTTGYMSKKLNSLLEPLSTNTVVRPTKACTFIAERVSNDRFKTVPVCSFYELVIL